MLSGWVTPKKQECDPDRVVSPPWTRRDISDMHYVRDKLDWLLAEVKSGFSITEEIHGWTIRNIMAIEMALKVKEFSYRAKFKAAQKKKALIR